MKDVHQIIELLSPADMNFIAPDTVSAEWLAMHRYWAGMNEEE